MLLYYKKEKKYTSFRFENIKTPSVQFQTGYQNRRERQNRYPLHTNT
jgi:hypothetical protein